MAIDNIDVLRAVAGRATICGAERDIMQYDGACYRALYALEQEGSTDVRPLYDLVVRLVPSLTQEQIDSLTAEQVGAIIAIPGRRVKAVEDGFPNSERPAATPTPA